MRIRARAPLRVSYAGGGTDVPPCPEVLGGLVLSSTLQNFAYCSLDLNSDRKVSVLHENMEIRKEVNCVQDLDGEAEFGLIRAVAGRLAPKTGFHVTVRYDAPPGAGLGSSSALCVALIGAFKELRGELMTKYDIANLAYEIERKDAGIAGGMQDQFASTFGGFNLIEFKKGSTVVNSLRIKRDTLHELEYNSILCFTGITRRSGGILKRQMESYRKGSPTTMTALQKMKDLTIEMKHLLLNGNLKDFGKLLNSEWELKKSLDTAISNDRVETLLNRAREAGAIGGKLLGAGGGGFLFLYCQNDRRNRVESLMEKMGCRNYPLVFDDDGLQTWRTE